MRLAFILSSLWLSGGVRVIIEYANRLTLRGYQVSLVIPGETFDLDIGVELSSKVEIHQSRVPRRPGMSLLDLARLTWDLARTVPPADVIISTHTPTTISGFLASRLWQKGRLIWLYQDYREMFQGRYVEDWLVRHALRWHELALVVSSYSRSELHLYSQGEVVVVGEGLSQAELFRPLQKETTNGHNQTRTILFLGDMRPRKGLFDFLAAAELVYQKSSQLKLLIVSKEDCQIETPVPLEYIYRPSRAELAELYARCDLFVSASWWESFGLPPLEAMACGAPVVMTDSRGVREFAESGQNCLLTPPRDPAALASAMGAVLSDKALAAKLGKNGVKTASRFTWDAAVDRFEAALLKLGVAVNT